MAEGTATHCDSAADGRLRSSCEANRRHSVPLPAGQDTQPLLHREVRRITRPLSRRVASGPYVWPTPLARIVTDAPTLPKPALRQTRLARPTPAPRRRPQSPPAFRFPPYFRSWGSAPARSWSCSLRANLGIDACAGVLSARLPIAAFGFSSNLLLRQFQILRQR